MDDAKLVYEIAKRVKSNGGNTYYVGGCVRDSLLGVESKDIDIEVHEIEPAVLRDILSEFGELRTQGAAFGVYNISGHDIDIAQPRVERSTGEKHTDFEVDVDPYIGIEGAAKRRDFTINAMMQDVLTGAIVDPFNGRQDLHDGLIRHVNDESFKEDPLRVFRAAQFAARFDFEIAGETRDVMRSMDVSKLSSERIYGELEKALMKSDKPSRFFEVLRDEEQLDAWFPEMKALIGCEQNPEYHPEGDVWVHTMQVIDNAAKHRDRAENPAFFMVAAMCHDFGKPLATELNPKTGKVQSIGHDETGVPVSQQFLKRVNHDTKLGKYVENMISLHMLPRTYFQDKVRANKTNSLCDKACCVNDLILLGASDAFAYFQSNNMYNDYLTWGKMIENRYNQRMLEPYVKGADLLEMGLKPGKQFAEILSNSHKLHLSGVDKDSVLNGIMTEQAKINPIVAEKKRQIDEYKEQFVISRKDLIQLGVKPDENFKITVESLNKQISNGKTKSDVLNEFTQQRRVVNLKDCGVDIGSKNSDDYSIV